MTKRDRSGHIVRAAAVLASGALFPSISSAQLPSVVFDLRVHNTGGKTATVSNVGDSVVLDLYATLNGLDADSGNERLQIVAGSFLSSSGGLDGDLLGLRAPAPFDGTIHSIGAQNDLDSDGDLDVGSLGTTATGKYVARSNSPVYQPPGGFFIGQVRFSATTITDDSAQINFLLRPGSNAGSLLSWLDGATTTTTTSSGLSVQYGAPVIVQGQTLPDDGVEYVNGTVNSHLSVANVKRVSPGGSLHLADGVHVTSTGSLDYGTGTLSIHINDDISGNAGGQLLANSVWVGTNADGTFHQGGGLTRGNFLLGAGADRTGTLNVTGGTLEGSIAFGDAGRGVYRQTGGSATLAGVTATEGALIEIAGGNLAINGHLIVQPGSTFIHVDGQTSVGQSIELEYDGRGATLDLRGGTLSAARVDLGSVLVDGRIAKGVQSGGTLKPGLFILSGHVANTSTFSTYDLSGGSLEAGSMTIDNGARFTQTGGVVSTQSVLQLSAQSEAQYRLIDGTIQNVSMIVYTDNSSSPIDGHAGGFVQTGGAVDLKEVSIGNTVSRVGLYEALGGTIRVQKRISVRGKLDFGGSAVPLTLGPSATGDFVLGSILNAQNATFIGAPGSLMSFASTAQLESIGSIQTQGLIHVAGQPLTIPQGQSLGGSSEIEGDVTNNGTVSPGNSPGVISITGNYTQSALATLLMELAGTSLDPENPGFDRLTISGTAALDGLLNVALLDGFVPTPDMSFQILSAASRTGTFDDTASGITLPQGHFDVIYSSTGVTLTNFQPVPEPGGLGFALAGLALRRRRRCE